MNSLIRLTTSLLAFVLFASVVSAQDTVRIGVDTIGDFVSIDIPDSVYLGNISRGFKTDEIRIDLANKGNTNIAVTGDRIAGEGLFDYLYFSKRITGNDANFRRLGDFSLNVSKPSSMGGTTAEYFYVRLDLTNYTGSLDAGVNRKNADIRLIAVAV